MMGEAERFMALRGAMGNLVHQYGALAAQMGVSPAVFADMLAVNAADLGYQAGVA